MNKLKFERAMLVYQAGLANVFAVDSFNMADFGRNAKRLLQYDFATCAAFARGLGTTGVIVRTAACNQAGDIARAKWTEDLESQPFSDKFRIVREMCEEYNGNRTSQEIEQGTKMEFEREG